MPCEHNRQKAFCKECGGSQICEHDKRKDYCKECGGSQICEHNRDKRRCKDCKGIKEKIIIKNVMVNRFVNTIHKRLNVKNVKVSGIVE
jgi:hypothetical protein